jgi:hypothetical protein
MRLQSCRFDLEGAWPPKEPPHALGVTSGVDILWTTPLRQKNESCIMGLAVTNGSVVTEDGAGTLPAT